MLRDTSFVSDFNENRRYYLFPVCHLAANSSLKFSGKSIKNLLFTTLSYADGAGAVTILQRDELTHIFIPVYFCHFPNNPNNQNFMFTFKLAIFTQSNRTYRKFFWLLSTRRPIEEKEVVIYA